MAKLLKIGDAELYPEQVKAGQLCVKALFARETSVILSAEMQQGKTGASIYVAEQFYQRAIKQGKTLHTLVIIADSRNDLVIQTEDRFASGHDEKTGEPCGANLQRRNKHKYPLTIVHRSALKTLDINSYNCDWCLIIIDESHIGEVESKDRESIRGDINRFLARAGMDLGNSPNGWKKGRTTNYLMAVSATDFLTILAGRNHDTFTHVHMERSSIYIGIPELLKKRIQQLPEKERLMPSGLPSAFFLETIVPILLLETKKHGPGYCIIRLSGETKELFIRWCDESGWEYEEATCARGNISEINPTLMQKPEKTKFLIISGSFRAGMTYKSEEHIRMVVETTGMTTKNTAALMQAVGRSCGNGKGKYTYPIFCNKKQLEGDALRYIMSLREHTLVYIPKTPKMKKGSGEKVKFTRWIGTDYSFNSKEYVVKRQSEYTEDFSKVIQSGSKHLGYGDKRKLVLVVDQLTTKVGVKLAHPIKKGTYTASGIRIIALAIKNTMAHANPVDWN